MLLFRVLAWCDIEEQNKELKTLGCTYVLLRGIARSGCPTCLQLGDVQGDEVCAVYGGSS